MLALLDFQVDGASLQENTLRIARPGAQQREIRSLTGLRGVAALYVVVYHYVGFRQPFSSPVRTLLGHGYLSVDLFFILSGFVMAMNYRSMFVSGFSFASYKKFLGRRIARVYPLYVVCTVAGFLIFLHAQRGVWRAHGPYEVLGLNLFMVQGWGLHKAFSFDVTAWSLSAEWAAYLLFPALLAPTLFRGRRSGWLTGLVCLGVLGVLCLLPQGMRFDVNAADLLDFTLPFGGLSIVRCLAEFLLGLLALRVAESGFGAAVSRSRWIAPGICAVTVAAMSIARTDLPVVGLFFLLIVCLSSGDHLPNRLLSSSPMEFLGLLSYAIYLLHTLWLSPVDWMTQEGVLYRVPGARWLAILTILPAAMLLNRLVEVPGRQWLRRAFERNPPQTPLERPATMG